MKTLRMLIVEDDAVLLEKLKRLYRAAFTEQGLDSVSIEQASTAAEAGELARANSQQPYDLVSLDVNLGDAQVTGLEVLEVFRRFRSAWMVALLTGVESDSTLDEQVGERRAEELRRALRRDAYARFDAERMVVIEKPAAAMDAHEAAVLLENRVKQIGLIYEHIGKLRYIFKEIKVVSLKRVKRSKGNKSKARKFIETTKLQWQIRYDCGEIRILNDYAGLRTLHHLLSMPPGDSLSPEKAMFIEPKQPKGKRAAAPPGEDPVAEYFLAHGVEDWGQLSKAEQDKFMATALSLHFEKYRELRGYQDEDDLAAAEADELEKLIEELGPLHDAAETAYQRLREHDSGGAGDEAEISPALAAQEGLHQAGGNYERKKGARGLTSTDAEALRQRLFRTREYLREFGFADFAEHLVGYLQSTGANWSYIRQPGVEWTTLSSSGS